MFIQSYMGLYKETNAFTREDNHNCLIHVTCTCTLYLTGTVYVYTCTCTCTCTMYVHVCTCMYRTYLLSAVQLRKLEIWLIIVKLSIGKIPVHVYT